MNLFHCQFQVATAALAIFVTLSSISCAQTARPGPVRAIVPCSAGSATDTSARIYFKDLKNIQV